MKVIIKIKNSMSSTDYDIGFNTPFIVGRGKGTHATINDPKLSSTHCRIIMKKDFCEVEDLDSKNGLYVNGLRIPNTKIYIGDEIKIGDHQITFVPERMDEEAIALLTYSSNKGNSKEQRIEKQIFDLKADPEAVAIAKGIIRKTKKEADTGLTPAQMRKKYKKHFIAGSILNIFLLVFVLYLPLEIINQFKLKVPGNTLLGLEVLLVVVFYLVNFKVLKFSFGERIVGLERMYEDQ